MATHPHPRHEISKGSLDVSGRLRTGPGKKLVAVAVAVLCLALCLPALSTLPAQASPVPWQDLRGPGNGDATLLACDTGSDAVFRSTKTRGIWKYQGGNWSDTNWFTGWGKVSAITVERTSGRLYVGTIGGSVWYYGNRDPSPMWHDTSAGLPSMVNCMVTQPSLGVLFVGLSNGVRRFDPGSTPAWSDVSGPMLSGRNVNSLIYYESANKLFAGVDNQVYSCDASNPGPTWSLTNGALGGSVLALTEDSPRQLVWASAGNNIYVYDMNVPPPAWAWAPIGGPTAASQCNNLVSDAMERSLFATPTGMPFDVWRYDLTDPSPHWYQTGLPPGNMFTNALIYDKNLQQCFAGNDNGVFVYSPAHPELGWKDTGGGISDDSVADVAFDSSRNRLYTSYFGVWAYEAGWPFPMWTNIGGLSGNQVTALTYDAGSDHLFAGGNFTGVYYCTPNGMGPTWNPTSGPISSQAVTKLYYDGSRRYLYAGTNNNVWRYNASGPILKAPTSSSWEDTGSSMSGEFSLAYDPARDVLYAGTNNGVMRCHNPTGTLPLDWAPMVGITFPVYALYMDSPRNILYAGTKTGGMWMLDLNLPSPTWTSMGGPLSTGFVSSLTFDQSTNLLYIGLYNNGVWSYDVNSHNWDQKVPGGEPYSGRSLALDSNNSRLYAGTDGAGVFLGKMGVPKILYCDPGSARRGDTGLRVAIKGIDTNFQPGNSHVDLGPGVEIQDTNVEDQYHISVTVRINASAPLGPRNVNVYSPGETPEPLVNGFTVLDALPPLARPPVVTSVSPDSGPVGTRVTISGSHFGGSPGRVTIGGVDARIISWSDTSIVVDTAGVVSGKVQVFNSVGDSNDDYTFEFTSPVWYLAEGSTAWGFNTTINIANPNDQPVTARVTYMDTAGYKPDGIIAKRDIRLAAASQTVVNPGSLLGQRDFSTKVECLEGLQIAADRTMSWSPGGSSQTSEHNSIGVPGPAKTWYLPEGSSAWGFDCWLLLQNPNAVEANVGVTYMIEGGGPKTVQHKVPAHSRATYSMANEIGAADASIKVDSDVPVVPERSMYTTWTPAGTSEKLRREGSNSIGTTTPANTYYLAEGSTEWGFTTYVLVQNPNDTPATVTLAYDTSNGPMGDRPFVLPAKSRKTVRLNDLHPGLDLSTRVSADVPIVAERSMYWPAQDDPQGLEGLAMHDSIGTDSPHTTYYLPDGGANQAGGALETYTLVENPNPVDVRVKVTYLRTRGLDDVSFTDVVQANTRTTYFMGDSVLGGASVVVQSLTNGKKIIAERAVYTNGRWGGSDTIGGSAD